MTSRAHAGWRWALVSLLLCSHAGSSQVDDGSAEFRAFLAESQEKTIETRLGEITLAQRQLDRDIAIRGRVYVRLLRYGLLPLSDGFEGMVGFANRAERLRRGLARDVAHKARIEKEQHTLHVKIAELRRERARWAAEASDFQRSREAILAARDRDSAFQRAFQSGWQPSTHTTIYAPPAHSADEASEFTRLRGRLPLPVAGRAELQPVQLPEAAGPGVLVRVHPGADVAAVFRGKVVLTGQYGELGRAVVIEHGGGYSTLSAQLGVITVEAGDTVKAGDPIGTLAEPGDGALYFQIREQGSPLSPAEWFGI